MRLRTLLICCVGVLALAAPVAAADNPPVEHPHSGIPPNVFATDYKGCLGGLRSTLARGVTLYDVSGNPITTFSNGFGPGVNPGVHVGTVGEEEFLKAFLTPIIGHVPSNSELAAFCSQFR